jgi:hypothetical protein
MIFNGRKCPIQPNSVISYNTNTGLMRVVKRHLSIGLDKIVEPSDFLTYHWDNREEVCWPNLDQAKFELICMVLTSELKLTCEDVEAFEDHPDWLFLEVRKRASRSTKTLAGLYISEYGEVICKGSGEFNSNKYTCAALLGNRDKIQLLAGMVASSHNLALPNEHSKIGSSFCWTFSDD